MGNKPPANPMKPVEDGIKKLIGEATSSIKRDIGQPLRQGFNSVQHKFDQVGHQMEQGLHNVEHQFQKVGQNIDHQFVKFGHEIEGGFDRVGKDIKGGFDKMNDGIMQSLGWVEGAYQKSQAAMHKGFSAISHELTVIGHAFENVGHALEKGFVRIKDVILKIGQIFEKLFFLVEVVAKLGIRVFLLGVFAAPVIAGMAVLNAVGQVVRTNTAIPEGLKQPIEGTTLAMVIALEFYVYKTLKFYRMRPGGKLWRDVINAVDKI